MDLVNLRVMGEEGGPGEPTDEQIETLVELRTEGKLDLIGVSNVTPEGARQAIAHTELGEIQNGYSLLDRTSEPVLELCREHAIAFVPFFPLGSAFTGGPAALARDPAVAEVAARHAATPSQIALAWLLARYDRMLLIPGTTSVAHLEENLAAGEITLDAQDMTALEGVQPAGPPHG